nr:hypothetical protein [Tanacetum cinerariifolium]
MKEVLLTWQVVERRLEATGAERLLLKTVALLQEKKVKFECYGYVVESVLIGHIRSLVGNVGNIRIYPELATLVKTISEPADDDHKRILFKHKQKSARKDVKRAFSVLKKKLAILANPTQALTKMVPGGSTSFGRHASDEELEAPMEDQPLPTDALPTALLPGYIDDSNPEEDEEDLRRILLTILPCPLKLRIQRHLKLISLPLHHLPLHTISSCFFETKSCIGRMSI